VKQQPSRLAVLLSQRHARGVDLIFFSLVISMTGSKALLRQQL
jgi:hypothetical protein